MPEPRQPASRDPWLLRIDLPRMQIKDKRPVVLTVDAPQREAGERVRVLAEVSATGDRHGITQHGVRGWWKLDQRTAARSREPVRPTWTPRDSVTVMADWEDARIVGEPGLHQGIQGPQRPQRDGVTGRPITQHAGVEPDPPGTPWHGPSPPGRPRASACRSVDGNIHGKQPHDPGRQWYEPVQDSAPRPSPAQKRSPSPHGRQKAPAAAPCFAPPVAGSDPRSPDRSVRQRRQPGSSPRRQLSGHYASRRIRSLVPDYRNHKMAHPYREGFFCVSLVDTQVIELAGIAVGAAPRHNEAMEQPPGSLRFARSRRGGAPTVDLPVDPTPNADMAIGKRMCFSVHLDPRVRSRPFA